MLLENPDPEEQKITEQTREQYHRELLEISEQNSSGPTIEGRSKQNVLAKSLETSVSSQKMFETKLIEQGTRSETTHQYGPTVPPFPPLNSPSSSSSMVREGTNSWQFVESRSSAKGKEMSSEIELSEGEKLRMIRSRLPKYLSPPLF